MAARERGWRLILPALGLFLLVVTAAMVALVAKMMGGFAVDNFGWAVLTAIIVSVVSWSGNAFVGPRGRFEMFVAGKRKP